MTLTPRKLSDLVIIAREGSLGRAAVVLGVSQPALSTSIAALERALGAPLLVRTGRGVSLTEYGRLLASRAERLEALLAAAMDDVRALKSGMAGVLRIGVSPVASVAATPEAIVRLQREAPGIRVEVTEFDDDTLADRLASGAFDAAISPAGMTVDPPHIRREDLFSDRLIAIASPRHPLAAQAAATVAQLCEARLIAPIPGSPIHRGIEALFLAHGAPMPTDIVVSNSVAATKRMVMSGDHISIVSNRIVEPEVRAGMLAAISIEGARARTICLRTLRTQTPKPAIEKFTRCLREAVSALHGD